MEIFKKLGDRKGIGISLGFLGDLYTRQGDLDLGMDYCQKGLEMIVST
jgi:hypothetical protein